FRPVPDKSDCRGSGPHGPQTAIEEVGAAALAGTRILPRTGVLESQLGLSCPITTAGHSPLLAKAGSLGQNFCNMRLRRLLERRWLLVPPAMTIGAISGFLLWATIRSAY